MIESVSSEPLNDFSIFWFENFVKFGKYFFLLLQHNQYFDIILELVFSEKLSNFFELIVEYPKCHIFFGFFLILSIENARPAYHNRGKHQFFDNQPQLFILLLIQRGKKAFEDRFVFGTYGGVERCREVKRNEVF